MPNKEISVTYDEGILQKCSSKRLVPSDLPEIANKIKQIIEEQGVDAIRDTFSFRGHKTSASIPYAKGRFYRGVIALDESDISLSAKVKYDIKTKKLEVSSIT